MKDKSKPSNVISNNSSDDKISKDVTIYILVTLLAVLIIYLFASKLINKRNLEISENYTVFSTEFTEASTDETTLSVNINTDNVFELTLLPGIGTNKANAIIEYRKENGDFLSTDEVMNVPGIGESIFNKLEPYIYIADNVTENTTENLS